MSVKFLAFLSCVCVVLGDVYMHNPRGSNNRNCRNDNNDRRRNGNRLFDSQNNDKGGYSCPRAYPFKEENNGATATVNEYGDITGDDAGNVYIDTETFFYYAGTELMVEWTTQHGCGANGNIDCRMIVQYMCNTEAPEGTPANLAAAITNPYLRDGTPINNNDGDNTNDEATTTIPEDVNDNDCNGANCRLDGRYGYQESHEWYEWCENRERNRGLFTADQLPVQGNNNNRAKNTRQNPNGNRRGLECPEERDYYPYWTPTMWKDVAIGVPEEEMEACEAMALESQNVQNKCYCDMSSKPDETPYPYNEEGCTLASGDWTCAGVWNLPAPQCFSMGYTRDNHLGNGVDGYPMHFNWTLPEPEGDADSMRCVLRLRYNASTGDFPTTLNYLNNCDPDDNECDNSPIYDRHNREEMTYVHYFDETDERYKLSLAVNTNQYARTFQDRTYAFDIKKRGPETEQCGKAIHNLNVRGKRGNIVQTYPSVEYDFVPQDLAIESEDCVHIQWIGSDYNPNRQPNNGEGGPYNPNNNNEAKADRSNLVQYEFASANHALHFNNVTNPLFSNADGSADWESMVKFAFLEQDVTNCDTLAQLQQRNPGDNNNQRQARERDPRNCAKLNQATTPYFKGGVHKIFNKGTHHMMSTRNNNFSNRSQKAKIEVSDCSNNCSSKSGPSTIAIVAGVGGGLVVLGALAFAGYKFGGPRAQARQNTQRQPMAKVKPQV